MHANIHMRVCTTISRYYFKVDDLQASFDQEIKSRSGTSSLYLSTQSRAVYGELQARMPCVAVASFAHTGGHDGARACQMGRTRTWQWQMQRGGSRRDRARSTFASASVDAGWFRCTACNLGLHYNACDVSGQEQEVMMSSQELLVRTVGKCRPTHSVIVVHVFARACLGR